jgi:hypothetical protein
MNLRDESDLGLRGELPTILTKVIAQAAREAPVSANRIQRIRVERP